MFNFGDNVDRDMIDKVEQAGDSRLSTNQQQIGDKVESIRHKSASKSPVTFVADLSRVLPTVNFVTSVYRALHQMLLRSSAIR